MRVIFVDVDGVLNYKKFSDKYMANFSYNYNHDVLFVDPDKVKVLADICEMAHAKVVLSSSWKLGISEFGVSKSLQDLTWMFIENGIDFLGVTPNIPNFNKGGGQEMWKEWDIQCYLYEHPEVTSYCIFDDETYDLETLKDHLIKTEYDVDGKGNGGILPEHAYKVRQILRKKIK